jgi:hypothetical protein
LGINDYSKITPLEIIKFANKQYELECRMVEEKFRKIQENPALNGAENGQPPMNRNC